MSEFMFGTGNGRTTDEARARIDEIAERHGAAFNNPTLPDGARYWFSGPNRGNPFDQALAARVWADLEAAGLADKGGLVMGCFEGRADEPR